MVFNRQEILMLINLEPAIGGGCNETIWSCLWNLENI